MENYMSCPWNLNTYFGRWMYYSWMSNPKLNFISTASIKEAKTLCYSPVHGPNSKDVTEPDILYAKQIFVNAFHPDTVEIQNIFGRLSFIPIGKALIIANLLSQYPKNSSSYISHGISQSYDSFVNFTNRNGKTKMQGQTSQIRLGVSMLTATSLSTIAAVFIERLLTSKICHPLFYRFIPTSTILVASIINVPIMRYSEIIEGVEIYDCSKNKIGHSRLAAAKGIGETIITRFVMFAPAVALIQYLEDILDNRICWFRRNKWAHFPFRSIGCGLLLIGLLPTACAIFPQFSSIKSNTLNTFDKEAYCQITENCPNKIPKKVYFNKGL